MGWRFVVASTKGKEGTEIRSMVVFMVWWQSKCWEVKVQWLAVGLGAFGVVGSLIEAQREGWQQVEGRIRSSGLGVLTWRLYKRSILRCPRDLCRQDWCSETGQMKGTVQIKVNRGDAWTWPFWRPPPSRHAKPRWPCSPKVLLIWECFFLGSCLVSTCLDIGTQCPKKTQFI